MTTALAVLAAVLAAAVAVVGGLYARLRGRQGRQDKLQTNAAAWASQELAAKDKATDEQTQARMRGVRAELEARLARAPTEEEVRALLERSKAP